MHYYDFNIGDYAKKTQHLTNEEDLAYRRALDLYYDTEKPLDISNIPSLSRRLRVETQALRNVIEEFFPDGVNKHADEEIAKYKGFSEAGKRGAAKRWSKGGDSPPIATPIATNNHKPITNNHTTPLPPKGELPASFVQFWERYPKKVGKSAALKAWKRLKPDESAVLAALEWQSVSDQWRRGFIPNPATYLNQGRWQDEKQAEIQQGAPPSKPWFLTASGNEEKGKELGLTQERNEPAFIYFDRVRKAAGITPEMVRKAQIDHAN